MTLETEFIENINTRLLYYLDIIEKTQQSIQLYKKNDIYSGTEYLLCIEKGGL